MLLQLSSSLPPLPAWAAGASARLEPLVAAATPHVERLIDVACAAAGALWASPPVVQAVQSLQSLTVPVCSTIDAALVDLTPWQAAAAGAVAATLLLWIAAVASRRLARLRRRGVLQAACDALRAMPVLSTLLARQTAAVAAKVSSAVRRTGTPLTVLPAMGRSRKDVLALLRGRAALDVRMRAGTSALSGVVYIGDEEHKALLDEAYSIFRYEGQDLHRQTNSHKSHVLVYQPAAAHERAHITPQEAVG